MTETISLSHQPCPDCGSSDALSTYVDGHSYCYSCTKYTPPPKSKRKKVDLSKYTYEYLPLRGISKETMSFYDVKTRIDEDGRPVAIGFKYPNESFKVRSLSDKSFWTEKSADGAEISKAGLFGRNRFSAGGARHVTITEGELDALSLYQAIDGPVVSVQSSVVALRDCAADRAWLNSFEKVYLAFDGDEPGRRAVDEVARLFESHKVYHVRFTKRKDANEFLQHGEQDELRRIWFNSKRWQPINIESSLEVFKDIVSNPSKTGVPYPFKKLTSMTHGIQMGETVLITAQEKVGKTEVMHFIEHQLLKETDDAIGAIFLEEPKERHLKALAGIHLGRPAHLPNSGCTPAEVSAAVEAVVKKDDRLFIYSHFGTDDPDVIIDTIRFLVTARACRYVLLDHISMVVSGSAGDDERRALDYLATKLEMMVKELNFALLLVSHVNDFGQTRGSRYISKVADTRIDITRDLTSPDPIRRRTWDLTLAYARYSGQSGPAGKVVYNPDTYSFTEEEEFGFAAANDNTRENNGHNPLLSAA